MKKHLFRLYWQKLLYNRPNRFRWHQAPQTSIPVMLHIDDTSQTTPPTLVMQKTLHFILEILQMPLQTLRSQKIIL